MILLCVLTLCGTASVSAQVIDVDQPSSNTVMAAFSQPDLAQSFKPTMSNCSGAGVQLTSGWGFGGTFTAQLWTALPNAGGTMLASGSASGTPGSWVDVYWPAVSVTPGTTYYMVYSCTDTGMAIDGDTNNPYAGGQVYANAGFGSFPAFDYTFRTWAGSVLTLSVSGCPTLTISVTGATPSGSVAFVSGTTFGSFVIPPGLPCAGTILGLANPTLRGVFIADTIGALTVVQSVPAGACGAIHIQALDVTSCETSAVVTL